MFDLGDRAGYFKLKIALLGQIARDKRRALCRWASLNTQAKVLESVETGGKAAVAMFKRKQEATLVAAMIQGDKRDRSITIQNIIEEGKKKQHYLMKKTIIRLFLNCDPDLRLMPMVFNRLKLYWRERKSYKQALQNLAEHWHSADQCRVRIAFTIWAKQDTKLNLLYYTPAPALLESCLANNEKMKKLDQERTSKIAIFDNLFYERDFLFAKFLKAQKLAISVGNQTLLKTKQRAFSKV